MQTVLIDLDNTIFDATPIFQSGFAKKRDFYYPREYDLKKAYPPEVAAKILQTLKSGAIYKTHLFDESLPFVLNEFSRTHTVYYVTSRSTGSQLVFYKDMSIVEEHYKSYTQLLGAGIRVPLKNIIVSTDATKMSNVRANNIDYVIDDNPIVIQACIDNNIEHAMISNDKTPYNHYLRGYANWEKSVKDALQR